jgi:drug/metabolite transporter (DMT)-like permease
MITVVNTNESLRSLESLVPMPGARTRLYSGAVLISFSPVFVALVSVSPTTSGFYRTAIGGAALAVILLFNRGHRLKFKQGVWLALFAAAVFFALDLWFWHRSILYIGPGLSTLLANLQVFFMMAAGFLVLGQRPRGVQLLAAPLAMLGLMLIVGLDWSVLDVDYRVGIIFGILTAASYAGYLLSMRRARIGAERAVPLAEVAVVSWLVAIFLGAAALIGGDSLAVPTITDGLWLAAYGVLAHAGGLILIASSLHALSATEAGIGLLLQPTLSVIWDVLLFGRELAPIELLGIAITLGAIFLGSVARRYNDGMTDTER